MKKKIFNNSLIQYKFKKLNSSKIDEPKIELSNEPKINKSLITMNSQQITSRKSKFSNLILNDHKKLNDTLYSTFYNSKLNDNLNKLDRESNSLLDISGSGKYNV